MPGSALCPGAPGVLLTGGVFRPGAPGEACGYAASLIPGAHFAPMHREDAAFAGYVHRPDKPGADHSPTAFRPDKPGANLLPEYISSPDRRGSIREELWEKTASSANC